MFDYRSRQNIFPLILGIIGVIFILLSEFIVQSTGEKIVQVSWMASIFITLSSLIIRFYTIDSNKFVEFIQGSNPLNTVRLSPLRYLNWMTLAMVVGLIATITIAFNFILGMLVYLVMQICLIISFSGLYTFSPRHMLQHPYLRKTFIVSVLFWVIAIPAIYLLLVYNGTDSLIVIPYVITIGIMSCISWFGVAYTSRSTLFRWMIILASGLFVFSDTLIGNSRYGQFNLNLDFLIDITYVINIFLLSHAVLFLQDNSGNVLLKN